MYFGSQRGVNPLGFQFQRHGFPQSFRMCIKLRILPSGPVQKTWVTGDNWRTKSTHRCPVPLYPKKSSVDGLVRRRGGPNIRTPFRTLL